MTRKANRDLCGIVLAGGEGKRFQSMIHRLREKGLGERSFDCAGTRSVLEHTFRRAEKLISPERVFTVVNRNHLEIPELEQQLSGRPTSTLVVQPENKGTGPELLLALMHVLQRFRDSTVVVFPSNHFFLEEDLFMGHVVLAGRAVARDPSLLVLLGMEPDRVQEEYGYIVPAARASSMVGLYGISRFVEKPSRSVAQELIRAGALWNMMVMVFRASALVDLVDREFPETFRHFRKISEAMGSALEDAAAEEAYGRLSPLDFSRDMLERLASRRSSRLRVFPVKGVHWGDGAQNIE